MVKRGRPVQAVAIIPAGGIGRRMNARLPKQYLRLGRTPVLVRTLRVLAGAAAVSGIVVAVPRERVEATRRLLRASGVRKVLEVVAGGRERQESVWLGLQAAGQPELGARARRGAAVHQRGADRARARRRRPHRRRHLRPPGARDGEARARGCGGDPPWTAPASGSSRPRRPFAASSCGRRTTRRGATVIAGTDDAVLVERLGGRVAVVPGLAENLKITTPGDLRVARLWTGRRSR